MDTQKYFLITLASTLAVGGKIEFKALLQGAIKNDISPISSKKRFIKLRLMWVLLEYVIF
ncbi:TPA: hypothetical protein SB541_001393 [Campylobacter jejuni]|nr:hypothetical protein [Campylobacter jejuni]